MASADTAGADRSLFHTSAFLDPDGLQVRKVSTFGFVVGVADIVPHHGAFST